MQRPQRRSITAARCWCGCSARPMRSPDFTRAVQLRPDYADAYTNAGNTQKGLGQYAAASQSLDRALAIKPRI